MGTIHCQYVKMSACAREGTEDFLAAVNECGRESVRTNRTDGRASGKRKKMLLRIVANGEGPHLNRSIAEDDFRCNLSGSAK
jgi:hypothetical protein